MKESQPTFSTGFYSPPSFRGGSLWLPGLACGIGACIAWLVSLPFVPVTPVTSTTIESHYSLGSVYGLVFDSTLGFLVCGAAFVTLLITRSSPQTVLLRTLFAACLGAVLVVGADAFCDYLNISLEHQGLPRDLLTFDRHVLVPLALVLSPYLILGLSFRRTYHVFLAAFAAGIISYLVRGILQPATQALRTMGGPSSNIWLSGSPSRLIQVVVMAAVVGVALAHFQRGAQRAWLRRFLREGEYEDYPITSVQTRIGSSPSAEVSIDNDPEVVPFHATIESKTDSYVIARAAGQILMNNQWIDTSVLQNNDVFLVGHTPLVFMRSTHAP